MDNNSNYESWLDFIHEKHSKEDLIFYQFAILWISFNSYLNYNYPKISGDHNKVRKFTEEHYDSFDNIKQLTNTYFSWRLQQFKDTKTNGRTFVIDMRTKNRKNPTKIPFDGYRNTCSDYFEIIYLIRCNYIHGEKQPLDKDDRELIKWAFNSLFIFWKEFLKNERKWIYRN